MEFREKGKMQQSFSAQKSHYVETQETAERGILSTREIAGASQYYVEMVRDA